MRYRVRYFYSKGVFLILLWSCLVIASGWSLSILIKVAYYDITQLNSYHPSAIIIAVLAPTLSLAFGPLAGWLADSRFGNFKVFKYGTIVILLASILACVSVLFETNVSEPSYITIITAGIVSVVCGLGLTACLGTALQLGLDQMPDASASNITSFINWSIFAWCFGLWISDSLWYALKLCVFEDIYMSAQVFSLFPVVCMSIACCTFLKAPKWLAIEPGSPKVLKTVYQVLKFAAKHKAPLNRSALTYWEEGVPSRLDLGKERYGGPFTTEQVEDVKTFFKIIVVHLPLFVISVTFRPGFMELSPKALAPNTTDLTCKSALIYNFSYSAPWCGMFVILLSEFLVYPLVNILHHLSTLRQMGLLYLIVLITNTGFLNSYIFAYIYPSNFYLEVLPGILYSAYFGCIDLCFFSKVILVFICAQSPYNMRGLLSGLSIFLHLSSLGVGVCISKAIFIWIHNPALSVLIHTSLAVGLSMTGLLLHCALARWYKRRVRDEGYHQHMHRTIEDIYSRRVSLYRT